jgi:two-component system sensor histidine kinase MtrB
MFTRPIKALRRSLATRVIFTTVTLFSVSAVFIGTAVFNQIRDRIIDEKISASIVEASSTIASAEFRFFIIQKPNLATLNQTFDDVLQLGRAPGALASGREIALLKSPENRNDKLNFARSSNFVQRDSIPLQLRNAVAKSNEIQWQRTMITYISGNIFPGIAIGKKINIPRAGTYEMYVLFSFESQEASIEIIGRGLIIAAITVFLLMLAMAYLIVRQVVNPIREIARVANSFTEGNFANRVKVKGEDEIAALGNSFNEMAFSIEQQISRLENLSRMQQRFVSDVSHELRNPLTTIRMASEVILSIKDQLDPTVARSAEILMAQIMRFDQLLSDLLEVSRFDAAVATLESDSIDLHESVKETVIELAEDDRAITISLSPERSEMVIDGDKRRIMRIIRNLLSNALDYSEGKEILITLQRTETAIHLGVRDFGLGLTKEQVARVFERFWRADPSRSRERGGTGLGLAIAQEDAKLHGGWINAYGEIGRGALFILTLPIRSGQPITDPPVDIHSQFDQLG